MLKIKCLLNLFTGFPSKSLFTQVCKMAAIPSSGSLVATHDYYRSKLPQRVLSCYSYMQLLIVDVIKRICFIRLLLFRAHWLYIQ